jgi:hypothetical protein
MRTVGRYDGELQMFVEAPREPSYEHLRFLRWLVEHGHLEHPVAGPPPGADRSGWLAWDDEIAPTGATQPIGYPDPSLFFPHFW